MPASGALASALDVADPPGIDGTVDEHAANATIRVAVVATIAGRVRATQNRMDTPVICGSYVRGLIVPPSNHPTVEEGHFRNSRKRKIKRRPKFPPATHDEPLGMTARFGHSERMSTPSEYPRSAGTQTFLDVFLRRKQRDSSDDIDAVFTRGEGRTVSCFLRSTVDPFPGKFRQGILRIDKLTVTWSPGFKGNGDALILETPLDVRQVRTPGGPGEASIKRNLFAIVEAASSAGTIELAVPTDSVELVRLRLQTA